MSHKHSITDPGHSHSVGTNSNPSSDIGIKSGYGPERWKGGLIQNSTTNITVQGIINASSGYENRPNNYTFKLWKRVN